MPKVNSIEEMFAHIGERFQPDKAEGVDAIFQFDLSGDAGGKYWAKVADKQIEAQAGEHPAPSLTITSTADDFMALVNGELNPMMAFMQGKIKVKGEMALAMKLQAILGF